MIGSYLQLALVGLLVVVVSAITFKIDEKTSFGKLSYRKKQIIIGIIFGILSILGTELGSDINDAVVNVRDAAPLAAGFIFGGPAGILAGLIGGIERYFCVYWGGGMFTREACTIATIFAGVVAAFLRKYMFENKRAPWFFAIAIGLFVEAFHMLMVFVMHPHEVETAYHVVHACAFPMIIINCLAVFFSVVAVTLLSKEKLIVPKNEVKISHSIQKKLFAIVIIALISSTIYNHRVQTKESLRETENLLSQELDDAVSYIADASDSNILKITRNIAESIEAYDSEGKHYDNILKLLASANNISEINIVGRGGVIVSSTKKEFIGFNMAEGVQSSYFLQLLDGQVKELAQDYMAISYDDTTYRKYAAVALSDGGFVQVGYDATYFHRDLSEAIKLVTNNRHIGENGFIIICDENLNLYNDPNEILYSYTERREVAKQLIDSAKYNEIYTGEIKGEEYYIKCAYNEGYYIFSFRAVSDAMLSRNLSLYLSFFLEILVFTVLFIAIFMLIKISVVNNINKINSNLGEITNGDLDVIVNVRNNEEFNYLSNEINSTVDTLKLLIKEASERLDKELEYAKNIQYSSLPHVFPPFPDRDEFQIWAYMLTAKEVGGDFYDFYFVGPHKLAFLIADVSGKGIPAALFMMRAKTMIKNLATTGMSVDEVFVRANNNLCENNEAEMFVTAWLGILDLETGKLSYVSAGHNPPLLWRKTESGGFEFLTGKRGLVLAGMEGINYRVNEMQIENGDILFLYTDGVTEATDRNNELYGDDRLKNYLSSLENPNDMDPEKICVSVKKDVDDFVKDADQFDDITMLCLKVTNIR